VSDIVIESGAAEGAEVVVAMVAATAASEAAQAEETATEALEVAEAAVVVAEAALEVAGAETCCSHCVDHGARLAAIEAQNAAVEAEDAAIAAAIEAEMVEVETQPAPPVDVTPEADVSRETSDADEADGDEKRARKGVSKSWFGGRAR
jgi:hypothetical protein